MSKKISYILIVIILENALTVVNIIIGVQDNWNNPDRWLSIVSLGFGLFLLFLSAGILVIFLRKNRLTRMIEKIQTVFQKHVLIFRISVVILVIIIYELFQDVLFLQSAASRIHFSGVRNILIEYFPLLIWALLVSIELLVVLLLINEVKFHKIFNKKNIHKVIILLGTGFFVFLLILLRAGDQIGREQFSWFEEINAPILGIQVFGLIIVLILTLLFLKLITLKQKDPIKFIDPFVLILLFLLAFVLWNNQSVSSTAFIDIPRLPNNVSYPRSDALGYEISAHQLMVGNGTGRSNHVGFWQYLAFKNLLLDDDFHTGVQFNLLILSFIPALMYLIVTFLQDRFSAILASMLFIVREVNGLTLVEHITIQQIKDQLTEPFVILGILLLLFLLLRWINNGARNRIYILLSGGVLGFLVLLRVEAFVYVAAVGIGIQLIFRNNLFRGAGKNAIFLLGFLLVAGPWIMKGVLSSGSILYMGMGRERLVLDSFSSIFESESELNQKLDEDGRTPKSKSENLGNNLISFLYYLPSNHQPFLTINNLPGLLVNRVDPSDLENDTYRDKYLERYVRSLPFWWNDWNGKLDSKSVLPIFLSSFLVTFGFFQLKENNRMIGLILVMIALFHSGIYSFIGRSGGRFVRSVDWVSIVFYSIGISSIVRKIWVSDEKRNLDWWWKAEPIFEMTNFSPTVEKSYGGIIVAVLLLGFGISFPLAETSIPRVYTEERLDGVIHQITSQASEIPSINKCLDYYEESGFDILYGKALFPRYFKAGQILEDVPGRNYTDPSIGRIEFYLTGTMDIWTALPGDKDMAGFEHGSEVIVVGKLSKVDYILKGRLMERDYLKARCILLLN